MEELGYLDHFALSEMLMLELFYRSSIQCRSGQLLVCYLVQVRGYTISHAHSISEDEAYDLFLGSHEHHFDEKPS